MTDNQKIAYEWAKSHDYPSIAARYARELAVLVDDLQEAYDDMAGDLELRTKQVRQLQREISAIRQQDVTDKDVGKWISVKDRLPEEKQRVLVRCKTVGTTVGWRLWGEWMTDLGDGGSEVAYWMPLPEPPEEGTV